MCLAKWNKYEHNLGKEHLHLFQEKFSEKCIITEPWKWQNSVLNKMHISYQSSGKMMWAGKLLSCKSIAVVIVKEEWHIFKALHLEGD